MKLEGFDLTKFEREDDLDTEGLLETFKEFDYAIKERVEFSDAVINAFCDLITSSKLIWDLASLLFTELRGELVTEPNWLSETRYKIVQRTRSCRHSLDCNCPKHLLQQLHGYTKTKWWIFSAAIEASANKEDQRRSNQVDSLLEELKSMPWCRNPSLS